MQGRVRADRSEGPDQVVPEGASKLWEGILCDLTYIIKDRNSDWSAIR